VPAAQPPSTALPALSLAAGGSDEPRLTVAAVARRLGVAPATLRTWDRRYGLGPSVHSAGAHRRYSAADVARLEAMRRLIHRGVAPADAASLVLGQHPPSPPDPPPVQPATQLASAPGPAATPTEKLAEALAPLGHLPDGDSSEPPEPVPPAQGPPGGGPAPGEPPAALAHRPLPGWPGPPERSVAGGPEVAVPVDFAEAELPSTAPGVPVLDVIPEPLDDLAASRGLLKAALALNAPAVSASVQRSLHRVGTVATWERLLRPVLIAAGQRWASSGEGIEVEHLLSDIATVVLREWAAGVPETGGRPVLLACAPDEQHSLPLAALSAGLGERGIGTRVLGPSLPVIALASAIRRTGPAAVFLWAQLPANGDASLLEHLPVTRPSVAVIVGGPGWRPERLPSRVSYAADLSAAIRLLHEAVALVAT